MPRFLSASIAVAFSATALVSGCHRTSTDEATGGKEPGREERLEASTRVAGSLAKDKAVAEWASFWRAKLKDTRFVESTRDKIHDEMKLAFAEAQAKYGQEGIKMGKLDEKRASRIELYGVKAEQMAKKICLEFYTNIKSLDDVSEELARKSLSRIEEELAKLDGEFRSEGW